MYIELKWSDELLTNSDISDSIVSDCILTPIKYNKCYLLLPLSPSCSYNHFNFLKVKAFVI